MYDLKVELCLCLIPKSEDADYLECLSIDMWQTKKCHVRVGNTKDKLSITPHLTLYQFALNYELLDDALVEIEVISKLFKQFKLNAKEYCYNNHEGSFEIKYDLTDDLEQIQHECITSINPLRGSLLVEKTPDGNIPKIEDGNVLKYGFRDCFELFNPHVTLNWFEVGTITPITKAPIPTNTTFHEIGLFFMGPNGTCAQKIKSFPLMV